MTALLAFWADVLDALLGRRCRLDCGQRVFPKDVVTHEAVNHAGDRIS